MKTVLIGLAVASALALGPACDAKDTTKKEASKADSAKKDAAKKDAAKKDAVKKKPDDSSKSEPKPTTTAVVDSGSGDAAPTKAPDSGFPVHSFAGTPFVEEGLSVSLKWKGAAKVLGCAKPKDDADCKDMPAPKAGQKLEFSESTVHVTPRVLTAKAGVRYEVGGVAQKEGDKVAAYRYGGEGTCEVAAKAGAVVNEGCPEPEEFDGFPPEGTADDLTYSKAWTWWVKVSGRWVKFDPATMDIVTKSSM